MTQIITYPTSPNGPHFNNYKRCASKNGEMKLERLFFDIICENPCLRLKPVVDYGGDLGVNIFGNDAFVKSHVVYVVFYTYLTNSDNPSLYDFFNAI